MSEIKRAIKKYPNRRLYDTQASSYITLGDIRRMVLDGVSIHIEDARTHEDLTRCVLLQIIMDEENANMPLFSAEALIQLIRCREQSDQALLGAYLEKNLQLFCCLQAKIEQQKESLRPSAESDVTVDWEDFLNSQTPAVQHMVTSYLEQTAHMFVSMQQQVNGQEASLKAG